jgi:hypothetical protein
LPEHAPNANRINFDWLHGYLTGAGLPPTDLAALKKAYSQRRVQCGREIEAVDAVVAPGAAVRLL